MTVNIHRFFEVPLRGGGSARINVQSVTAITRARIRSKGDVDAADVVTVHTGGGQSFLVHGLTLDDVYQHFASATGQMHYLQPAPAREDPTGQDVDADSL